MVRLILASDHGGFELKEALKAHFAKIYQITDVGCESADSVDFPVYVTRAITELTKGQGGFAVLVCGSGIGVSMAANRFRGIRAALCHNEEYAQLAREHNNANVLCLGGRFLDVEKAISIVNTFSNTKSLTNERYSKRNNLLDELVYE